MEVTGVSSINILWLRGRHSRQLHVFHQAVHSADTDVNAIITLQYVSNLIGAKSFVVVSVNVQYIGPDDLIFLITRGRAGKEVLIVGTSVYLQDTTQDPDVVLQSELVDSS